MVFGSEWTQIGPNSLVFAFDSLCTRPEPGLNLLTSGAWAAVEDFAVGGSLPGPSESGGPKPQAYLDQYLKVRVSVIVR